MGGAPWQLPGFVVGELLGSGNSSEVWAARIAATGERVALKRVALTEPDALRAARTEAALLTALDHPHLVRLHALIPTPEAAVLVLDLADGGSLADMLARRSRLAVGEVVTALAPIGAALAYAHQRGVLHGDVTPGNVLFTSIGLPMLGDLGVARIVGDFGEYYLLGYYSNHRDAGGRLRRNEVHVNRPGTKAFYRSTYVPAK